MMKLAGAFFLVLAGLAWGMGRSRELRQRVEALSELQRLMQWIRTEISWSARPLPELISVGDSPFCREAVKESCFPADASHALLQAGRRLLPQEKDRILLQSFTSGLGTSDIQGQLEHLALCMARVENSLEDAREAVRDRSRLYVGLGAFGGIGLCVLLL